MLLAGENVSVGNRDVESSELIYGNTVGIALFFSSLQEFLSLSVCLSLSFSPPTPPTSPPLSFSVAVVVLLRSVLMGKTQKKKKTGGI